MNKVIIISSLLLISQNGFSQDNKLVLERIIEQIIEENEKELDYTELHEALYYFSNNPINLNNTTKEELRELYLLNSYQIERLLIHINKNGALLSYLELQTIAGFDIQTIQTLLPFIIIKIKPKNKQVFKNIKQYILIRDQFYLQEQKGYIPNEENKTHYLGNAHKTYFKYRLKNNYLQAGITAEKDYGENFLGPNQPYGFDFYSAYLQAKNIGKIKTIIIGDYQVNLGQGVIMQSGISFGKSSEVINTQKSGNIIKGHTAAEENLFFRGVIIQAELIKNFELITFFSSHKVDANITDTLNNGDLIFSSIKGTGMHRTENELLDKNIILQNHYGVHTSYSLHNLNIGSSYYFTKIYGEYNKSLNPYNQFELNKNTNQNLGFNYQYLYKNINLFGEIGISKNGGTAYLNGIMIGLDKTLSASLLHRNYATNYQNEHANSFSEKNTRNETGFYFALEFTPNHKFKIKGYADNYQFPWLRFGIDAPTKGNDYLLQSDYKINRTIKIYARYKSETIEEQIPEYSSITNKRKDNLRFHINYNEGESWMFSNRFERTTIHFNKKKENGHILYQDVKYKPLFSKITFSSRYVLFNSPTYESRIYAYENDVLYGYSIPAYYGKGNKVYLVIKYNIIQNLDFWLRVAHTTYGDRNTLRSGWDEIKGNKISEIKVQLRYKF